MKKVNAACLLAGTTLVVGADLAAADPPGPGDKQCIPGQQGNPHPAHKAGAC
jgi:hypothetical protein